MRTTLDLDESVLLAAKAIVRDERISIGAALARLARRGLAADSASVRSGGFPVFTPAADAAPITLDVVNSLRDGDSGGG